MPRPTIPNRRAVLLDVAEEQILQQGFDAVRIADVARQAGVGKGAVYLEFTSKEALLEALLTRAMGRMVDHSQRVLDEVPDDELSFTLLYRAGVEALLSDRLATAALLSDRNVLGKQVEALGSQRYASRLGWVRALLGVFAEAGAIPSGLDLDGLAIALSAATLGLLQASSAFGPLSKEQLEGALTALVLVVERGVSSRPVRNPRALRQAVAEFLGQLREQVEE
ncbi:MAG: helix-turn-helix domain-containing protein [Propionibacteriaceae bacterium]|nr:helix-turn-helix domain-containing protein [Propionibacteriaceae bacterium]